MEGESFDILVGSGSGEGLEVLLRRLHKRWDPFEDWKTWTCQAGRAARSSGTTGGLDEPFKRKEETHGMVSATRWQKT